ncbi:hypothetical protein NE236_23765 [Actinoallomurus purpureus]|uniref:hypothetical protein n=1 Tax=Actinoallomurus purpureus TaxID=478114 RepID=UPI002092D11B|nr:hypothetical protein [Actinoallomurus purpureus]MCO6008000.1 hypothetical protein [Actinoallomurus purpureus]
MAIYALGELTPDIHPDAYVHPDATVIGAVTIGARASIWPAAVHIALGVPARSRPAPDLAKWVDEAVGLYQDMAARYNTGLRRIG